MNKGIFEIARKELAAFFASPTAFIFLGTFLLVNLFIFFWVETFFARNIADVRPLFEWMPTLMIFLVAALTMKMWSEERRMGTLEFLFTLPVSTLNLVLGKFFACMGLVSIAVLLTLPLPLSVSFLGHLDWGPVFGAYIATIFLAAAYSAIGLFISSKSDNQIVSLILTTLACGAFYIIGSSALTPLFGNDMAEILKSFGTGSRFESITRGVIDLRDIYYYLSIVGIFLCLNVYSLERLRWSLEGKHPTHKQWRLVTALLILNFFAGNLWLAHIHKARLDITQGNIYSISDATRTYLDRLQEPLLIRGYFSEKTHPLLAPLVPRIRDLIREYEIAGAGKVRSEFIDPRQHPDLEEEANQKFNIKPIPFQISDKYQASLVNSYFDVLVQYGDKFETLSFQDLIEVKVQGEGDIDVQLRNPEYDITRAIKKALYGFQGTDHLFASISQPIRFTAYVSGENKLPEQLVAFERELKTLLQELEKSSKDKLATEFVDPEAGDGSLAKTIAENYGFQPMQAGLFSPERFYFYMILSSNDQVVQVPLPENLDAAGARRSIEAALKRFSSGFLKTVGISTPPRSNQANPFMQQMGMNEDKSFQLLQEKLQENFLIRPVDLSQGRVPEEVDLLLVVSPTDLSEEAVFAVDQFLMKGGTIVMASAPFSAKRTQRSLSMEELNSGLEDWFKQIGIELEKQMVLDPQNENYPIPVARDLGGFTVQEVKMVPYPFFVDVRDSGMNQQSSLTSGIPQVTLNWASPLKLDAEKNKGRTITRLLQSSPQSWTSDSLNIIPDWDAHGPLGFRRGEVKGSQLLAAVVEGHFDSYFKERETSPLLKEKSEEEKNTEAPEENAEEQEVKPEVISSIIRQSPESGRIILFASNDFVEDQTLRISASTGSSRYLNSVQLIENAIDWSLEDRGLLTIRSRGHFSRTLEPLTQSQQFFWEYLNYGLSLFGLLLVYLIYRASRSNASRRADAIFALQGA